MNTTQNLTFFQRLFGHLHTIGAHRRLVCRLCFRCHLYKQGLLHDLSKYSPTEFLPGVRFYQGFRSPNALEREQNGYSRAWLHHKGRNKHHFEYWIDVDVTYKPEEHPGHEELSFSGGPMPTRYVVEMMCDRLAACHIYEKDAYTQESALRYFQKETSHYYVPLHPQTRELLVFLLEKCAAEGEDAVITYMRDELVKPKAGYGSVKF